LASQAKATPKEETYTHGEDNRNQRAFPTFCGGVAGKFLGDLQARTRQAAQQFFAALSERQRDRYMVSQRYVRSAQRQDYRNGYYERDFVTKFGTLRLRVARTRKRGVLPEVVQKFQRRAEDVTLLIREAFLRGISTLQVGRVVTVLPGEAVSAQTVSRITRSLDQVVEQFHQARLSDDCAYLFLDGVSLRIRRPTRAQAGTHAGGLRGAPRRYSPPFGRSAQPG
jgi:putative transposase